MTDHKPLVHVFNPTRSIPQMAASRIQRWNLTLHAYSYTIRFKLGKHNSNADALSWLPLPTSLESIPVPGDILLSLQTLATTPVNAVQIKNWASRDPLLSKVKLYVQQGWPITQSDVDISPFFRRKDEHSIMDGCILWGSRVVIPPLGRPILIRKLHDGHPGTTRMKSLARGYMWWPNMDYAGPFMGDQFLVIIDAHSKWVDVHMTTSATSKVTTEKLRNTFATLGLPKVLVSDNGPAFISDEFQVFLSGNGIIHQRISPYHPASNGLAERTVQRLKRAMKQLTGSLETRLSRFLFNYRITPQSTTGVSPAELMFSRCLRSRFDLLYPDVSKGVQAKQLLQQKSRSSVPSVQGLRTFQPDNPIYCRDFSSTKPTWQFKKKT